MIIPDPAMSMAATVQIHSEIQNRKVINGTIIIKKISLNIGLVFKGNSVIIRHYEKRNFP